jgi:predicted glycogen debranching enzyme
MGSASLVNRRKYHALLIASTNPPVERYSCLAGLDEVVVIPGESGKPPREVALSGHRLVGGRLEPDGPSRLVRFEKSPTSCRWVYDAAGVEVVKELRLAWRRNACAVRYFVRDAGPSGRTIGIRVTPRITMRDFHGTLPSADLSRWKCETSPDGFRVSAEGRAMSLVCAASGGVRNIAQPSLLRGLHLDMETERSQEDVENICSPGWFEVEIAGSGSFTIAAALEPEKADPAVFDDEARSRHLAEVRRNFAQGDAAREALGPLVDACDDYLVPRTVEGKQLMTVLAGFPWFADWGRDTMISMVGLMLVTRRFDDARGCLETFARYVSQGMIPNLFDDYGGPPQYNTVDASLWFLHASRAYLDATGDRVTYDALLAPACLQIIEHYRKGTRYGIGMDPADGLIFAGDHTTQLTWMDAKRDGVVFTPRHGKAVEINALWRHGLVCVAAAIESRDAAKAAELRALAVRVGDSFRRAFWFEKEQRLHDCLQRDEKAGAWRPVPEVRPNQVFAASLEHSGLTTRERRAVVECVRRELLTPFGLRTLSPRDPNYRARFDGDMMARDAAYHNGTVWPWLIGPYCEAVLRAGEFSPVAKAEVQSVVQPLLDSLGDGCLGQIAEVYDADEPRRPQACIAQAWSVAETLRACVMSL